MTFKDLIEEIGVPRLSELLSVEESHVRTMKARDSIPPEYWGAILGERSRLGLADVGFDELRRMRNTRFSRDDAPQQTTVAEGAE